MLLFSLLRELGAVVWGQTSVSEEQRAACLHKERQRAGARWKAEAEGCSHLQAPRGPHLALADPGVWWKSWQMTLMTWAQGFAVLRTSPAARWARVVLLFLKCWEEDAPGDGGSPGPVALGVSGGPWHQVAGSRIAGEPRKRGYDGLVHRW